MASLDSSTTEQIDDIVYDLVRKDGIPGLSVAVTDGSETLYTAGYGSRDLETNAPATPQTVYGVASVTKSFVALSILQLAEADRLSLDDPVTEHLDVDVPESVTLHHLLSHSSGYPSLGVSETLIDRLAGIGETGVPLGDRADFEHHLAGARDERFADAGDEFAYCNTGYVLLGDVVETVDGRPFGEYATAEILEPLEMSRSTFDHDAFTEFEDRMTPYWLEDGDPEETAMPARSLSDAPGGLLAPVTDLARYLRFMLGTTDGRNDGVLDRETVARATAGHVETPDGPYGYGWRRREICGRTLVGHSGSLGVSAAYVGFNPETELGVAIGANTSPEYPLAVLGQGLFAALVGEDPEETVPFFERRRRFERLTGDYESYRGVRTASVERDGRFLRLEFEDDFGGSLPLVPADGTGEGDRFWALTADGNRQPVRFDDTEGVTLRYERWRLDKQ